ncbi:protein translocase subunit SecD [Candidatus Uhrbacteria bacterium]|jgi:protein-export membrane protein SecD|nr:protein translocase subunit SecD [Candidatus Uhrbacteria bacterium]MBT7717235.1 protein translocase subunit SecD [Candidatus Uhrbacteria bacterium]
MDKKRGFRTRRGLYSALVAIAVVFVLTGSAAFPNIWNTAARSIEDTVGMNMPEFNEEDFKLGLDLQGGVHLVYEADMSDIESTDRGTAIEGVRDVIERRVNAFGVSEPIVQTNINGDHYRIIVELAGIFDVEQAVGLIGETPILEFKTLKATFDEDVELTADEQTQMDEAQTQEESAALEALDRALAGEDFGELARELSISSTSLSKGYYGYINENDPAFGELAQEIQDDRLGEGVIDGLYEYNSTLHIVNYTATQESEEVELSHILICHSESEGCEADRSTDEAWTLAEQVASEVTASNFADKAIEYSDGPSGPSGGYLDWVVEGMMVEPFEDAAFVLSDGAISGVVETQFGYHVIYRSDSRSETQYEISHIEMPWTTESDILDLDPWENTELSGKNVERAAVGFDQNTTIPYVLLNFDGDGAQLFEEMTEQYVGEVIGIFLDGTAISTPVVQDVIYGGEATISGDFTVEEAKLLAQRLNAGALPVPIELLSQQTVGPTLGKVSLESSIQAAMIGIILLALFMVAYYRLSGLLAIIALIVYTSVNLALYKWLGVTMTLSGIAGFILSLGMAVDANVLIFERLKEELKSGRDLSTAIDEGFRRAWTSIRDGNITTLIAAGVLFTLSGFIKGFALTLAIGILVSMMTAIFVTRILLQWVSGWKPAQKHWLYGIRKK